MLDTRDLSFAFALHVLVVVVIIGLNQWRTSPLTQPERTIQVKMVSLATFLQMQKQSAKSPRLEKTQPLSKAKPNVKKTLQKAKVAEEALDFDPFAPMESAHKQSKKKKISGKEALAVMLNAQLSNQEIERYKLGMQRAVERQWKVPTEMIERVHDALVSLTLYRNGKVANIELLESSGSVMLDKTLIQAIYAAAPFVLPSQQFALFQRNTIRFRPLK